MSLFRRQPRIAKLCRECGWLACRQAGDHFQVTACSGRGCCIIVRDREDCDSVVFQAWFPVQFPLDNPPSGLFGRLLLRNLDLRYAGWEMTICRQCEAALCVAAQVPSGSLEAEVFETVCREIVDEVTGFHQELREKFRYGTPSPASPVQSPDYRAALFPRSKGQDFPRRLP